MSRASYGFGLEKLGLLSLHYPKLIVALVVLITAVTGLGLKNLSTDAAISDLFKASTTEYADYDELNKTFPTSEYDILLVLESKNLLGRETLDTMRDISQDLALVESVEGVISMFDMRGKPNKKGYAPLLIPADLPEGKAFDKIVDDIKKHPLITGKLVSKPDDDGTRLTMMQLTLQKKVVADAALTSVVKEIRENVKEIVGETDIKFHLAGTPIMQMEIRDAIKRDRLVFNVAGFLLGFIICFAFFRRPKLAFIASICPVLAVMWAFGIFGHMELKLNTFLNIVPPLVLVIAYSDAMHLVYAIRRRIAQGDDKKQAIRTALLNVGPACVLTSLTTSLAMLSLAFADSAVIRQFGLCAAFATMVAFFVIILVVPTLSYFMIGDEEKFREGEKQRSKTLEVMENMCGNLASWLTPRFLVISMFSGLLMLLFTAMHFQLQPKYKLSDQLPDHINVIAASELIDEKLSGAFPIHVIVDIPDDSDLTSNKVLSVIAKTHQALEKQEGLGNVWSLEILRRWVFKNFNSFKGKEFSEYVEKIPAHLRARMISPDKRKILFTGHVPNLGAEEIEPIIHRIQRNMSSIKEDYPEFNFKVTGLLALTSLQSRGMIEQLNNGLIMAMGIVILMIGVAFRSFRAMILSIAPNIFPIAAAGALLYVSGNGLEYASVIGLTVAFGLAVDDSIHFLNRLFLEREREANWEDAVFRTVERIGPVLMLTTIVLVLGLAVTILSDLPPLRLFGMLSMTTLAAALVADLVVLPAVILAAIRLRFIALRKEA